MKQLILLTMLMMLPACSTSTPTYSMPKPDIMSAFRVGEAVRLTFRDGQVGTAVICMVGQMGEVTMDNGSIRKSRIYTVKYSRWIYGKLVTDIDMVPEFVMELIKQ